MSRPSNDVTTSSSLPRRRALAVAADALTAGRALLAAVLLAAVAADAWGAAAVLLCLAWMSDALDGRLARSTSQPTRLGGHDLNADTAVGAGLLIGLVAAGTIPWWLGLSALVVLGGGYVRLRNPALSQVLQAIAYAAFLLALRTRAPETLRLPLVTVAALAVLESRRLFSITIPMFFRGIADLVRSRGARNPDRH